MSKFLKSQISLIMLANSLNVHTSLVRWRQIQGQWELRVWKQSQALTESQYRVDFPSMNSLSLILTANAREGRSSGSNGAATWWWILQRLHDRMDLLFIMKSILFWKCQKALDLYYFHLFLQSNVKQDHCVTNFLSYANTVMWCICWKILHYTVKKVTDFPVRSRDVTNQTLPGR